MKGADQCPRCASRRWTAIKNPHDQFYASDIRICANCRTAWEPFDPADIGIAGEPRSAFREPCNNCAFRKGSPEQADKAEWAKKLYQLERGASFHCHKGVPISPDSENGFDYPEDGKNPLKLRLCRGFLNACVGKRMREHAADVPAEPWSDE
ncbi:hypothetical protein BSL82_05885 [Tardibacter chloracetimidivorans]|uniref:Uncharacterized protein n=1 Tax=Tardibacter chloracetimidivorans TaxID=1921510 RepID=A0A1L3ZTH9_9SPHN|nr:hypothetical protein [Tardibacter chloracetimidivorans]API58900.1 hypothetical protein BSL82_05885 [Tardibacter chloracetimidivorans]